MQVKCTRWRLLAGVLGAIGISLGLASWGLWIQYAYTKPQLPEAAVGRIYSLNTHGLVVYLNRHEHFLLDGLQVIAGVFFAGGIIVDVISSRRNGASFPRAGDWPA